jgi:hypothetical protein
MAAQVHQEMFPEIDSRLDTLIALTGTMHLQAVAIGHELRDQLTVVVNLNDRMDKTQEELDTLNGVVRRLRAQDDGSLLL